MNIIRMAYPFSETMPASRQVLAIGYFDGVHQGHQTVFRKTISIAQAEGIASAVMTFDPHPREVLGGAASSHYITPLEEKLSLFRECGLDRCYILNFDRLVSKLTPEQFVRQVLFALQVDTAVVGFNFTYGHLGRGTVEQLKELGGERMKVHVVRPFLQEGFKVSSTLIREHLHAGRIEQARELLGRSYAICGKVVHGMGRGSTIGIPTANIETSAPYVIPANGVYAVTVGIGGARFGGVMNVGVKPTFVNDPPERTLEVHIFDFNDVIYDKEIRIEFIGFIRDERKFGSVEELVVQIKDDIKTAKSLLPLFT